MRRDKNKDNKREDNNRREKIKMKNIEMQIRLREKGRKLNL